MALSINSPADVVVTEGQAVDIPWVASGGTPETTWSSVSMPTANSWRSSAYGNGKFVAIGYNSTVVSYSTDGITWTNSTLPSATWYAVAYGNGRFVAISSSATCAYSTDGITWTGSTLPSNSSWRDIVFGGDKFIALKLASNTCAYSTDGITWTNATLPSSGNWYNVTYGDGKFVAIQTSSTSGAYSADGITWTAMTLPSSNAWYSVTYGNGRFVAVGNVSTVASYSTDGINWTNSVLVGGLEWQEIVFGNGIFVALASYSYGGAYSSDGVTWVALVFLGETNRNWRTVVFGGGKFVAIVRDSTIGVISALLPIYNSTTTKNGSPYSTATNTTGLFPLNIPTAQTSDAGTYAITVTNAGASVSDSVAVTVNELITDGSNKLIQGTTEVSILSRYGYKTEIKLCMDKSTDSRGIVRWLDDGIAYDSYKTTLSVRTETPLELETLLCDDSTDVLKLTTPNTVGLFPFTAVYATGHDYYINVASWKTSGDAVILGEVCDYELSIVPSVRGMYDNTPKSTDLGGCIVSAWKIGNVDFPFSEWEPELNDYRRVIELNGNNSELVDSTRTYGDIAKIKVNCSEEQSRRILSFILFTMRGSEQVATFPDSYHIFGRRYSGMSTCKVRLYEPILNVTHNNYESVDIEFTLQMVGV